MSVDNDARTSGPPLDQEEALRLDVQIQAMADEAGEHLDYLADLLAEAKAGQIHLALQFDTWTAYLVNRLKPVTKALDADDRRELVVQLYEAGMSVRAIAEAVGTSKSTVARQVSQSGTAEPVDETTGLDGKRYPRDTAQPDSAPKRNGGGGYRGDLTPDMRLNRAKSSIRNIDGLAGAAAELQTEICKLIDELRASIKPVSAGTDNAATA